MREADDLRQANCVQPTEPGRKLVDLGFGRGCLGHYDRRGNYHSDEGEGDKQIMHGEISCVVRLSLSTHSSSAELAIS